MPNLEGVGTPISYTEDNPILNHIKTWRAKRWQAVRDPRDDEERKLLADWLGYRGRREASARGTVGAATYAFSHMDMDLEWRHLLAEHIAEECSHGWNFVKLADRIDPSVDHAIDDPEFARRHGLDARNRHSEIVRRDFPSFIFAGNPWIYGHVTATVRLPGITTQEVVHYQRTDQLAGEEEHHYHMLQKIHDTVWELVDKQGLEPVKQRIAEIDEEALNNNSRTIWDPPTREFLVNKLGGSLEMAPLFLSWRKYLYNNVLGWDPEPVTIKDWPPGVPQSMELAAV
ncbi:MAG TPA: hypothetical protein VF157_13925 [Chloroflexota bacterium]